MPLRTRTTSGPKPNPTLFTKYSPHTRPASNRAVWAVTSRRTARTGLCRYTPASFAKSFPLPIGTTPRATSPPPWQRSNPFATSCTVPSPPTATIRCAPACTARAASSAPWPGRSVRSTSTDHPWWWNSRAMGSSARAAAPRPAAGLSTTWAWIRGFYISGGLVARVQVPLRQQQLGVQDRRSGGAPDRVVAQRDEAVPQHAIAGDPAHADAHAPTGVAVEPRLRAIGLVAHDDGALRGAGEAQLLGQRGERRERLAYLRRLRRAGELHPHRRHVPVHHVHPMALRAHRELPGCDPATVQAAEDLPRLPLDLFLFVRDEGHHVVGDVEGGDPGVSRARERLERRDDDRVEAKAGGERRQRERDHHRRAIGIRHDESPPRASLEQR